MGVSFCTLRLKNVDNNIPEEHTMQLTEAKSVFETEAVNYLRIMTRQNNTVGFKIPEYQRPYNWHKGHLKRLLEDCINGFYAG